MAVVVMDIEVVIVVIGSRVVGVNELAVTDVTVLVLLLMQLVAETDDHLVLIYQQIRHLILAEIY